MGMFISCHAFPEYGRRCRIGGGKAWLKFTYYLNPAPNDRNLEFDPKRNLFTNLSPREVVSAP